MKRRLITFIMAAAVALTSLMTVGCGESDSSIKRVKHSGSFKVGYVSSGLTQDDMPYVSDDGGIVGDLAQKAAKSMRVDAQMVPVSSDEAYDKLLDGSVDCLWNVSAPAKKYVSSVRTISTDIYCRQVLITVSGSDIEDLADVKGKTMAVVSGSDALSAMNDASVMKKSLKSFLVLDSLHNVIDALRLGEADCAVVGYPQAMYINTQYPNLFNITDSMISESMLVIAFRAEDNKLCEKIAKQYVNMMKKGEINALWRKYAGGDFPIADDSSMINGSLNT